MNLYHFKIRTTGLPEKNIEILFEPKQRLFDLTHKTPLKSLCVLLSIFMGEDIKKCTLIPQKVALIKSYKN